MLILLLIALKVLPTILKGKHAEEIVPIMFKMVIAFVGLSVFISAIGLIVWVKVRRGKGPPPRY
jgi:hypothetical protein